MGFLDNTHLAYQLALINYYHALTDTLEAKDWVFHAQHMKEITDLRLKAKQMQATEFYEYAVPVMRKMLS